MANQTYIVKNEDLYECNTCKEIISFGQVLDSMKNESKNNSCNHAVVISLKEMK